MKSFGIGRNALLSLILTILLFGFSVTGLYAQAIKAGDAKAEKKDASSDLIFEDVHGQLSGGREFVELKSMKDTDSLWKSNYVLSLRSGNYGFDYKSSDNDDGEMADNRRYVSYFFSDHWSVSVGDANSNRWLVGGSFSDQKSDKPYLLNATYLLDREEDSSNVLEIEGEWLLAELRKFKIGPFAEHVNVRNSDQAYNKQVIGVLSEWPLSTDVLFRGGAFFGLVSDDDFPYKRMGLFLNAIIKI